MKKIFLYKTSTSTDVLLTGLFIVFLTTISAAVGLSRPELSRSVQVIFILLAVLVSISVVFIFRSIQRIVSVAEDMESVAADVASGKFDSRVVVQSKDEFGRAAIAFNKIVIAFDERDIVKNFKNLEKIIGE